MHRKAKARLKSLDFDAALPLLEQLKSDSRIGPAERAEVLIELGITHVNLGQVEEAKRDFDDALTVAESARPPISASPKVLRLFEDVRLAREARLHPPPPPPEPPQKLVPAEAPNAVAPAVPLVSSSPAPIVAAAPPRERWVLVPAVLAGVGVGALVAGAFSALQSQAVTRELTGALHPSSEVMALQGKRSAFATASYVGYGAGGVLLLAGAALFIFTGSF